MAFSHLSAGLTSWHLLGLQALIYSTLAFTIQPQPKSPECKEVPLPFSGLAGVGIAAGVSGGMLGGGRGLVMMPLMVRLLAIPIHLAIRFSSLGVLSAASAASVTHLSDGRAQLPIALLLGGTAAFAAQWSASRLESVPEKRLVWMMRGITLLLAVDSGRPTLALAL